MMFSYNWTNAPVVRLWVWLNMKWRGSFPKEDLSKRRPCSKGFSLFSKRKTFFFDILLLGSRGAPCRTYLPTSFRYDWARVYCEVKSFDCASNGFECASSVQGCSSQKPLINYPPIHKNFRSLLRGEQTSTNLESLIVGKCLITRFSRFSRVKTF